MVQLVSTESIEENRVEDIALPPLVTLSAQARSYVEAARAPSTRRAYLADWRDFTSWCAAESRDALPASPETVSLYVTSQATRLKPQSLTRRVAAISVAHQSAGLSSPTNALDVRLVLSGIRRIQRSPRRPKKALEVEDVRRIAAALGALLRDVRDRAILLLGFAAGLRRSELVALDVGDLEFTLEGVLLTIRRSKTDQEAKGRVIPIPNGSHALTCPVSALRAWLAAGEIQSGPVFRTIDRHGNLRPDRLSDKGVARTIKRLCALIGLPPASYAGHSLRSGFATSAARAGASEHAISLVTGHRSVQVLRRYIQCGLQWQDNASAKLGL